MARVRGRRLFDGPRYSDHLDRQIARLAGEAIVTAHLGAGAMTRARLCRAASRAVEDGLGHDVDFNLLAAEALSRDTGTAEVTCRVPFGGEATVLDFSIDMSPDFRVVRATVERQAIVLRAREMLLDVRVGPAILAAELDEIRSILEAMQAEHERARSAHKITVARLIDEWWPMIQIDRSRLKSLAQSRQAEAGELRQMLIKLAAKFDAWDPLKP